MFKKSILTLLLLAAIGYVSAQSLRFELDDIIYENGSTIVCTNDEYGYGEYIQHMQLRNLTSGDLNVIVEKEVLEDLGGTMNFFCWGQCFSYTVFVSDPVTVAANSLNESDLSFHVMFEEPVYGKVKMRFYAYDEQHPEERIYIDVIFNKEDDGISDYSRSIMMSQAYPNPARSTVRFDYSMPVSNATAVVYNVVGQEVMRQDINTFEGQLNLSVADLIDGIYFCSIMLDGKTANTVKFVVKK